MPKYDVTVEGSEYEVDAPDENTAWQWAYMTHQQRPAPSKARTMGEAVTDIGAQFKGGIGKLAQFPGQLYGLATGDFSDTGLYGYGKEMEANAEAAKSAGLKAREAARAQAIAEAEKKGQISAGITAAKETITDPALFLGLIAESIPGMLVPAGAAVGVGRAALQKGLAKGVEAAAAREAAIKAGTRAAVGTGAVQQGADVGTGAYEEVYKRLIAQKVPESEAAAQAINLARAAGVSGAVISLLAQRLPGASRLEEVLAGKTTTSGLGRAVLGGALKEPIGELPEEVGGKLTQNVALRAVDPTQSLTEGLGQTAGTAAVAAAGLGGLGGGISSIRGGPAPAEADAARQQAQQRILEARERERVKAEGETPIGAMGPYAQQQYGELEQEKQQLMQGPQAPNVKERIAEITKQQKQLNIAEITRVREETKQQEIEAKKAAASAFSQPEVRETPEGQGELFSQFEAPQARVQPELEPAVAPPQAEVTTPPEQMELGLPVARGTSWAQKELDLLKAGPKTPESRARMEDLKGFLKEESDRSKELAARGYTAQGQGRLFTPTEMRESGLERGKEPLAAEPKTTTPKQMERAGQGAFKFEAPKAEAGITGTTQAAIEPLEPIASVQPVSEAVPEPKLAPKRVVPPELQPVIDSLTAAGVRPETKTWAENGRNRPFLRKLVSMSVMAPEARQAARKALKLEEGSHKAEAFDALFPAPRVPAFEPAAGAGKPSVGIPSKPRPVAPAEPTAAGAGETVGRGVVPVGRTAPTPAAPEGGAKLALEAGKVTGFTTAKGSTYEVTPEGQTIRTKKSPGRGQGETSEPHTALYVSPKASESILEDMQGGMGNHSVRLGYATDTAFKPVQSVAEIPAGTKPAVGVFNKKTGAVVGLYEAETAPRIGLSPVEKLYSPDGTSSTHIGNKITQVVEAGAKPEPTPKKTSLKEAEAAWEDNNVEGAGTRLAFKDLSPERKKIWKDSVEDGTATIEEYERLAKDQADIAKAEKRKAAADAEAKRATEEAEAAEKKAQLAAQIREREQAKRDKAEAKRKEEERVKAEREAETKAKADAAAARERAKRETEETPKAKKGLTREKAEELLSDLDIDPDTTKSKVKALAKRMRDAGLVTDNDVNALERISKDRDMGAEDLIDELRSSLAATEVVAKAEKRKAARPDEEALSLRGDERAKQLSDFEQTLRAALNKFGLKDIGLKLINGMTAEGSYAQKLIQIAADSANPIRTLRHEAIHALRELGFFTDAQWQSLSKMAKDKWIDQYLKQRNIDGKPLKAGEESRYDAYMREYDGNTEKITEEAVADAFADFDATKPPAGMVAAVVTKLRNLFQSIKSALTKVESPEQIFGKVERGELKAGVKAEREGEAKSLRAPSPTEGIAETSELMKEAPGEFKTAVKDIGRIFTEKDDVSYVTRFRTETTDASASVVNRMNILFDGAVRDELTGINNPEALMRQAGDTEALANPFFQTGGIEKDATTDAWVVTDKAGPGGSIADMLAAIKNWSDAKGMDFKLGYAEASKLLEARRLDAMRQANEQIKEAAKKAGVKAELFPIHKLSQKDKYDRTADEQIDAALRGLKANPEVQAVADMMDKQRAYMIDHMVAVGRISKETSQEWKDAAGYVPFDRVEDFFDKYVPRRTSGRGITQLGSLPKYVGSTQREVGNVFDNHTKLMGWMLKQTIKHDAGSTTLNLLADMGQARRLHGNKLSANNAGNVVKSYKKGQEEYFEVRSHWDAKAFLAAPEPKLAIFKLFAQVSNILRKIVTVMPPFIAKQVTDDIQRGFLTSGVRSPSRLIIPAITNFLRIAGHEVIFGKDHPFTKEFAKKGLVGNIDYNASNPAETILFSMGYSKRGWLSELHHRLESITRASDLAMRKAIYDRTMVEENNNVALATVRAREFINFRRRGASTTINLGVATIPFFNAYLQANDLLLRSMVGRGSSHTEKAVARRLFWMQAAKMTGFALIYSLANSDDEKYKDQTLADRSNNWIIGGKTLPVPGDMAALFKVPVEVLVQYMARQGTKDEQLTSEVVRQVLGYAYEQFVGRVTPIPQAIRPVVEALTNHSFLTNRELVGTYQQGMPKPLQATTTTSELAKTIAEFAFNNIKDPITDTPLQLSPVIIDNYARGYLGGVVPLMNMLIDQLLNPNKTDRPLSKYWFLSQYLTPEVPTGPTEEFYDLANKVMPAKRALAQLEKTDMPAAMAYYEKNKDNLLMAELVNKALQEIEQTRAYIKYLDSAEGAKAIESGAERLKMKQEVERYKNENLKWVRSAKAQIFGKKE